MPKSDVAWKVCLCTAFDGSKCMLCSSLWSPIARKGSAHGSFINRSQVCSVNDVRQVYIHSEKNLLNRYQDNFIRDDEVGIRYMQVQLELGGIVEIAIVSPSIVWSKE